MGCGQPAGLILKCCWKMFQLDGFFPMQFPCKLWKKWYFLKTVESGWASHGSLQKLVASRWEPQGLPRETPGPLASPPAGPPRRAMHSTSHMLLAWMTQITGVPPFSLAEYPTVECVWDSSWKVINWIIFSHRSTDRIWNFIFYQLDSK